MRGGHTKQKPCKHRFTQATEQPDLVLFCWKCGEVKNYCFEEGPRLGFVKSEEVACQVEPSDDSDQ